MARTVYIYALIDPRTNEIRYVGKTNNPAKRLAYHCSQAVKPKKLYFWGLETIPYRNLWITDLRLGGLKPKMLLLEKCPATACFDRERWWVESLSGHTTLVNGHLSGRAGRRAWGSKLAPQWLRAVCPNIDWERAINPGWRDVPFEQRFGDNVSV